MTDRDKLPADFLDLVDGYCSGQLGEEGQRRLEAYLVESAPARREFVAYFQMHTELEFTVRARNAASAALKEVEESPGVPRGEADSDRAPTRPRRRGAMVSSRVNRWSSLAAGLLIAVIGYAIGQYGQGRKPIRSHQGAPVPVAAPTRPLVVNANVAWLVNAQDCLWAGGASDMPGRDMKAGKTLRLQRGLAEIEFDRGARLILQGPAGLELLSGNEARLLHGSLTARVPHRALGFTVYSPRGKVVDLGTEFGLSVDERGGTAVRVFEGKVVASPIAGGAADASGLLLHEDQSARIDGQTVALKPGHDAGDDARYVREIVPPPFVTPHTRKQDFSKPVAGTLRDTIGQGVGLTHRLPGTGEQLAEHDLNLRLTPKRGALELTTTCSDINTQQGMDTGEYLGFRLADMGFTGAEDFAISATIPEIPGLASVGQFGLYAGSKSDKNIRGGLISQPEPDRYLLFLVNNDGGRDSDLYEVGLTSSGDDLRLTLRRIAGLYSLVVENLTRHSSSTLSIAHPAFLDGQRDLFVGLFGANTQSNVRKTLTIKDLDVKVWTVSPEKARAGAGTREPERGPH